jgi:NADPH-dependent 7-cyano-7-deazaguanine reductase QueF
MNKKIETRGGTKAKQIFSDIKNACKNEKIEILKKY